ncbi:hypothetical protein JSO59_010730 [Riemerella anatipestifer]|uniref:hypothetical protein n=1 Tax=Riemerella anatipestifer TaxID=34085 RepID=UPI0030BF8AD1
MRKRHHAEKNSTAGNKVLPQAGVNCFLEKFVYLWSVVFQLKLGANKPRLRQYPDRWW